VNGVTIFCCNGGGDLIQLQTRSEESLCGTHRRVVVVDDLRPVYRTVCTER
jgi:hypothetical protein